MSLPRAATPEFPGCRWTRLRGCGSCAPIWSCRHRSGKPELYDPGVKAISALSAPVPVATTMNWRPERVRYVIGLAAFSVRNFSAPDFLAGLRVEGVEIAVAAADEDQAALRHHRAAAVVGRSQTIRQRDAFQQRMIAERGGCLRRAAPSTRSRPCSDRSRSSTAYGGEMSGRPPGKLTSSPPRANTFE